MDVAGPESAINSGTRAKLEGQTSVQTPKDLEEIVQKREANQPPLPPSKNAKRNNAKG